MRPDRARFGPFRREIWHRCRISTGVTASLEDQVRAHLDAARGLNDAALKVETGHADEITSTDAIIALFAITKALMDCAVDLAAAIDQLAEHTGYEPR